MKVWVCYTEVPCEGYSEPEAVFADKKDAEKWLESNKVYYSVPKIIELDIE